MGLLDDWMAKLRGEATKQAGNAAAAAAAAAATAAASKAASGIAEDFLSFAEGELDEARGARGLTDGEEPTPLLPGAEVPEMPVVDTLPKTADAAPVLSARERREAAEAKAREELVRLKAELLGKKED